MHTRIPVDGRAYWRVLVPGLVAVGAMLAASSLANARPAPESFADLAAKVSPAVVNITSEHAMAVASQGGEQGEMSPYPEPFRDFLKRFFGPNAPEFRGPGPFRSPGGHMTALGSGFIVDPDGYVVTNNHVIDGAKTIKVRLSKGQSYNAKLIGTDPKTDIALLKIDAKRPLPFVTWGDSDKIRPGDWVMTIGNPFGLGGTVTAGIVSARGRDLPGGSLVDFLQIDAPINKGNSGGPAFNEDGKVIGIDTAIYSPNGGSVGIGFAIPSNTAKEVVAELRAHGKIERGWLGVEIQPVTPDMATALGMKKPHGAIVASVRDGGPAAKAGIAQGDVIVRWDGKPVAKVHDLVRMVAATKAGSTVKVGLLRNGESRTLSVETGAMPGSEQLASAETGESAGPGRLAGTGITVANLDAATRARFGIESSVSGVVVSRVNSDSSAAENDVRPGDVIKRIAGTKVRSAADAVAAVTKAHKSGRAAMTMLIDRNGQDRFVALRFATS